MLDLTAAPSNASKAPNNSEQHAPVIVTPRRSLVFYCMSRKPPHDGPHGTLQDLRHPALFVAVTSPRRPFEALTSKDGSNSQDTGPYHRQELVRPSCLSKHSGVADQLSRDIHADRIPPRHEVASPQLPCSINKRRRSRMSSTPSTPLSGRPFRLPPWRSPLGGWRCMTPSLGSWQIGAHSKHLGTGRKWTPV